MTFLNSGRGAGKISYLYLIYCLMCREEEVEEMSFDEFKEVMENKNITEIRGIDGR
jgi:hypothetical protein